MQDQLNALVAEAQTNAHALAVRADFESFKARFVGPNGSLTQAMKGMGTLPKEQKPVVGKLINEAKQKLEAIFATCLAIIEEKEMAQRLGNPVDPSLASPDAPSGTRHPLAQMREEIVSIFRKIGFTIAEGSEVETEWHVFDALNTKPDHPARDLQDTYYFPDRDWVNVKAHADERYLLRTHTSSVQIRTLLAEKPPLRIISPGRCFRRDTVDATHSSNFHQVEGLYIDKKVTVKDLKAVLDYFFRELLGPDAKTRFRPHFFPYTEPSFEVDFHSAHLAKLGKQWVEIMGCGMVDPEVFKNVGYDPEQWSGFAFGMGIERIAMIVYGIDDIRYFYQNDLRFLRQF